LWVKPIAQLICLRIVFQLLTKFFLPPSMNNYSATATRCTTRTVGEYLFLALLVQFGLGRCDISRTPSLITDVIDNPSTRYSGGFLSTDFLNVSPVTLPSKECGFFLFFPSIYLDRTTADDLLDCGPPFSLGIPTSSTAYDSLMDQGPSIYFPTIISLDFSTSSTAGDSFLDHGPYSNVSSLSSHFATASCLVGDNGFCVGRDGLLVVGYNILGTRYCSV